MPKTSKKPTKTNNFYLDRLSLDNDLEAIFEAARLDQKEGRDVLPKLKRMIEYHVVTKRIDARKYGYQSGLHVALKNTVQGKNVERPASKTYSGEFVKGLTLSLKQAHDRKLKKIRSI